MRVTRQKDKQKMNATAEKMESIGAKPAEASPSPMLNRIGKKLTKFVSEMDLEKVNEEEKPIEL